MSIVSFPTVESAITVGIAWGAVNREMYAASNQYRHTGLDLYDASQDTPIYSVAAGVVKWAGYEQAHGYGRHILIEHNIAGVQFYTRYAHLAQMFYADGYILDAGDKIGIMGGELSDPYRGASGGKHLHFEVLLPEKPGDRDYIYINWNGLYSVDPLRWLEDTFMSDELGTVYPTSYNGLNIRSTPDINGSKIGALPYHEERVFIDSAKDSIGNLWVKLRSLRDEWVCVEYRGEELAFVSVKPPLVTEPELITPEPSLLSRVEALEKDVKTLKQIAGLS